MKNRFKNLSGTTKTIILFLLALYLSFTLLLYQLSDASSSGIMGALFYSIAAGLDSFFGISIWFLIILIYGHLAVQLKFISSFNIPNSVAACIYLSIAGLSGDGALGIILASLVGSLFGESSVTVVFAVILTLSVSFIPGYRGRHIFKGSLTKLKQTIPLVRDKISSRTDNEEKDEAEEEDLEVEDRVVEEEDLEDEDQVEEEEDLEDGKEFVEEFDFVSANESYNLPSLELLDKSKQEKTIDENNLRERAHELENAIKPFLHVKVSKWIPGLMATTFYTELETDAKVSSLLSRANDIARSLGLPNDSVRFSGNIEGHKNTIGIELPNTERSYCLIRKILEHASYKTSNAELPLALGISVDGEYICEDLSKMPHLMLAGSTGSGKSVALNSIIFSLIYKKTPSELNLVLIDPKIVELSLYRGIPHLIRDVVTDMDESIDVLKSLVNMMDKRYWKFQDLKVTNISDYNGKVSTEKKMARTVVVIDEFSDLMLSHGKKTEDLVGRLSQKARAAGIHLILSAQRPTSDIIKGLIKTNVPARMAFKVANQVDSRVIIDSKGAESMLGNGDFLLHTTENKSLKRIQSPLVSTEEIIRVVQAIS